MRPRRLIGLLLLAGLSGAVGARADEPPLQRPRARYYFRLDYRVAPGLRGCLSRPEVRELLAGQLDYDAIRQDDGPGQIVVEPRAALDQVLSDPGRRRRRRHRSRGRSSRLS